MTIYYLKEEEASDGTDNTNKEACDDLRQRGIPEGIVRAVALLTHDRAMSYEEYIQSIIDSENPIALQVKYNDLQHKTIILLANGSWLVAKGDSR